MKGADFSDDAADGMLNTSRILKSLSVDMVRLLVVEARLFGRTGLAMIGLCLMIALFLASGWLFAGATAVVALANLNDFSLMSALLTVTLVNLALGALVYWRLRYISRDLKFRESRASVNILLAQVRSLADSAEQRKEN